MKKKISVIIPFLNEAGNIPALCSGLNTYFQSATNFSAEVIFVNDGSSDNSNELLRNEKHNSYEAKLITLSKNFGSHAALRAGIMHATGDLTTFIYADLQDPLELISRLFQLQSSGFDIVWATRNNSQISLSEKLFSRLYAFMMQKFAIKSFPENGFDIVMFNEKIRHELNATIEANSSVFLQILSMGFRQTSISYNKQNRKSGKSKWTLSKKIKLFVDSFVAFSFAPVRLVTFTGIGFAILGFIWTAYIVSREMLFHDLQSGWPALVAILMVGFGITNISLGILAEYLWRTLDASRNRKVFIIDETIELKKEITNP